MINKINIKEVASFNSIGVKLNLKEINYIFGSNGTGKTTISEFLRNKKDQRFSTCTIDWENDKSDFDIFVYNKHFVEDNFNIRNEIKGIFTLGKESSDKLKEIDEKNRDIKKHEEKIDNIKENLKEKEQQLNALRADFQEKCWGLKLKYDDKFKDAFKGFRDKKVKFMEKCIYEAQLNQSEYHTYDKLLEKVNSVFKAPSDKINTISEILYDISLETNTIFQTTIIGKKDLDIAKLINNLNLSDWVKQGQIHVENANGICPFCQQVLPDKFKEKLDEYFDETYAEQLDALNSSIRMYEKETIDLIQKCQSLNNSDIPFIDKNKIANISDTISSIHKENLLLLEMKVKEPSRNIKLKSLTSYLTQINLEIKHANIKISETNRVIDNIEEEKEILVNELWRFVVEENKSYFSHYMHYSNKIKKAIEGMHNAIDEKEKHKDALKNDVIRLQSQLISILPSISYINSILKSSGFTNFQLAESDEKGSYKLIRENGEDANETLSEGEKTFISFLYFYQLLFGAHVKDTINNDRIIVIDDPVSSLDSNILFIVSNLIGHLKKILRYDGTTHIKQLIVLTHNVYFHKEISFNKAKGTKKLSDESFWILRKTDNISYITEYDDNPIKSSYELLWNELKENPNSIAAPNIMRRILENYFKFFGNVDIDDITKDFPIEQKVVCGSLLSWVHDGSHHMNDDLYVDNNHESNSIYFNIFKQIFVNCNHQSHFDMMMGDFEFSLATEEVTEHEVKSIYKQAVASME